MTEVTKEALNEAKKKRRCAKSSVTRTGNGLDYLLKNERHIPEVEESLANFEDLYKKLVEKHDEYIQLVDGDEEFATEEEWIEDYQQRQLLVTMGSKSMTVSLGLVKAHPTKVNPHPTKVNPHPTKVKPHPTKVKPHPTKVNPQPTKVNPHPTKVNPHPTKVKPHPTKANPHPTKVNPHPTKVNPQPTKVKNTIVQVQVRVPKVFQMFNLFVVSKWRSQKCLDLVVTSESTVFFEMTLSMLLNLNIVNEMQ
jgi:hypothetical protein